MDERTITIVVCVVLGIACAILGRMGKPFNTDVGREACERSARRWRRQ